MARPKIDRHASNVGQAFQLLCRNHRWIRLAGGASSSRSPSSCLPPVGEKVPVGRLRGCGGGQRPWFDLFYKAPSTFNTEHPRQTRASTSLLCWALNVECSAFLVSIPSRPASNGPRLWQSPAAAHGGSQAIRITRRAAADLSDTAAAHPRSAWMLSPSRQRPGVRQPSAALYRQP